MSRPLPPAAGPVAEVDHFLAAGDGGRDALALPPDAAEERGLTFGPDPATHNRNTLGGMIGNNSCGMHAQMAGKVEENTDELEILTYDGVRLTVGVTQPDQLDLLCERQDRVGQIYRDLVALSRWGERTLAALRARLRRRSCRPCSRCAPRSRQGRRARLVPHSRPLQPVFAG